MSERCKVCVALNRRDIEKAMEVPRSDSAVSRQFKLSRATVVRHRAHIVHMPTIDVQDTPNNTEISRLKAETQRILDTSKDDKVRLHALQRLESLHGLELRIQQEAQGSSSLTSDPAFQMVASALASVMCAECLRKVDALSDDALGTALSHAKAEGGIPALEK